MTRTRLLSYPRPTAPGLVGFRLSGARLVALLGTVLLIVAGLAVTPAQADSRSLDPVCPAHGTEESREFFDDGSSPYEEAITCALGYGIVSGDADGQFHPQAQLTRAQMATVVTEWLHVSRGLPLPEAGDHFADDDGSVHETAIDRSAAAGLIEGRSGGIFAPHRSVTRASAASFAARMIDAADDGQANDSVLPAGPSDHFTDDDGSTHHRRINQLAEVDVVAGTGADAYSPDEELTRGQAAALLARAAAYADGEGLWLQGPTAMAVDVTPTQGTSGKADTGDTWRVGFDEAVQLRDGHNARFLVELSGGEHRMLLCSDEFTAGLRGNQLDESDPRIEAYCEINSEPVTVEQTEFPAGHAMTARLEEAVRTGPERMSLSFYPVWFRSSTNVSDVDGRVWMPRHSDDQRVGPDVERIADTAPPGWDDS